MVICAVLICLYSMLLNFKSLIFLTSHLFSSMGGAKIKQSPSTKCFHNINEVERFSFPDMFFLSHLEFTKNLYIKNFSKIHFWNNLPHEKVNLKVLC